MNVTLCILGYLIVCNGVAHANDPWQIVLGAILAIMTGFKELIDATPLDDAPKVTR